MIGKFPLDILVRAGCDDGRKELQKIRFLSHGGALVPPPDCNKDIRGDDLGKVGRDIKGVASQTMVPLQDRQKLFTV